jgi:hypothetical protein
MARSSCQGAEPRPRKSRVGDSGAEPRPRKSRVGDSGAESPLPPHPFENGRTEWTGAPKRRARRRPERPRQASPCASRVPIATFRRHRGSGPCPFYDDQGAPFPRSCRCRTPVEETAWKVSPHRDTSEKKGGHSPVACCSAAAAAHVGLSHRDSPRQTGRRAPVPLRQPEVKRSCTFCRATTAPGKTIWEVPSHRDSPGENGGGGPVPQQQPQAKRLRSSCHTATARGKRVWELLSHHDTSKQID